MLTFILYFKYLDKINKTNFFLSNSNKLMLEINKIKSVNKIIFYIL